LVWRDFQISLQTSQIVVTGYFLDVAKWYASTGHLGEGSSSERVGANPNHTNALASLLKNLVCHEASHCPTGTPTGE
jgi:hypothetical protein